MKRTPMKRGPKVLPEDKKIAGMPWPAGWIAESQFQKLVEEMATTFGWRAFHCHFPFFDAPGLPDLYLQPASKRLQGRRSMWRELKVRNKQGRPYTPSPKQWEFLTTEIAAGGDAKVWLYPDDWVSGTIEAELKP